MCMYGRASFSEHSTLREYKMSDFDVKSAVYAGLEPKHLYSTKGDEVV